MAHVSKAGDPPVNESERTAIKYFEANLPDTFTIHHNLLLQTTSHRLAQDFDLIIISPFDVYAVEVKGYRGTIRGNVNQWWMTGGKVEASPIHAIGGKAKDLHSWFGDRDPPVSVFVDGIVVLTEPGVQLRISEEDDGQVFRVMDLERAARYMQDPKEVHRPPHVRPRSIALLQNQISGHLERQYRPREPRDKQLGDFRLVRALGAGDGYEDHLAENVGLPTKPLVRLRLYENDSLESPAQRQQRREEIRRQASALKMLKSDHIPGADSGFMAEQDLYAQPLEWIDGPSVRQLLDEGQLAAMTTEERVGIARDVALALQHAHDKNVIHRDVRPENIIVPPQGKVTLINFDLARIEGLSGTVLQAFKKHIDLRYTAREVRLDPSKSSPASDQYALGVVLFELLSGAPLEHKPFVVTEAPGFEALGPEAKEVLTRMCADNPGGRFGGWDEVLEWLGVVR